MIARSDGSNQKSSGASVQISGHAHGAFASRLYPGTPPIGSDVAPAHPAEFVSFMHEYRGTRMPETLTRPVVIMNASINSVPI